MTTPPIAHPCDGSALPARLFDLIQAPLRWQLLAAGLEFGLFDRLSAPTTAADLAADLSLDAGRLGHVLDALAAMDLLVKSGGRYRLAEEAAPYLRADGERSLRDLLTTLPRLRHGDIAALLRGEAGDAALDMAAPEFWDRSAFSLRAFHRGMGAAAMIAVLESLPEWPSARRFLDLGAGSETLALTVAQRRPDMTAALVDLPPMADRIAGRLAAAGPAGRRVAVIADDFNDVAFDDPETGGGYDVIWASLTLYYARDLVALLTRARRALAPGGVLVSLHEGLTAERTRPETHVVGRLVAALRGQDRSFDQGAIAAALSAAGFGRVESRDVATAFGPFRLDCGRDS
ncbi:SAM-dependent methyltransferase [Azospirillum agricola]|uniref:class I SAM-dependent methyltransferase n=1 Tax=Azospirillum agricola TaxID=1720247 RepID=UPI001AEA1123|nr:class I SAM-dependent methyltransferase [Azospirillum agricola]MBP2232702.1 SAM-dependent methyltransferase [Azospirillum agricola]